MKKKINNRLIRSFGSCYDPLDVNIPDGESLKIKDWIDKYRNTVKNKEDVIWLLCRPEFMSNRDCRLFSVWCAREALKLISDPDQRSVNACDVAEKFANGDATSEELVAARDAAWSAAGSAAGSAAWYAAGSAAGSAAWYAQIDQLLTYFN